MALDIKQIKQFRHSGRTKAEILSCKPQPALASGRILRRIRPHAEYEYYKTFIEEAVANDAPPSLELIENNKMLSAWESGLNIAKVSSFPVNVHIAITDVCNARCSFCSYAPETSTGTMVRLEHIARFDWLKFAERFYPQSSLGEPLAHPQIAQIFHEVRNKAPFIQMGITTNAGLLGDDVIAAVAGHLSLMVVSLNAARQATYDATMPPLKWEKTIGNLKRLHEFKLAHGLDKPKVQASYVVHKHNLDEIVEVPALLKSLGIRELRVLVMSVPKPIQSRRLFDSSDLVYHEPARVNRIFDALHKECFIHGVRLVAGLPKLAESKPEDEAEQPDWEHSDWDEQ